MRQDRGREKAASKSQLGETESAPTIIVGLNIEENNCELRGQGTELLYRNDFGSADASGRRARWSYEPEDIQAS